MSPSREPKPTDLDKALAEHPTAEADSRAVKAAADPTLAGKLDAAARKLAKGIDTGGSTDRHPTN